MIKNTIHSHSSYVSYTFFMETEIKERKRESEKKKLTPDKLETYSIPVFIILLFAGLQNLV